MAAGLFSGASRNTSVSVRRLQEDLDLARRWYELTVFPVPFDLEAAAAAWRMEGESGDDSETGFLSKTRFLRKTREALSELAKRSLLDYDTDARHYSLHDLLREVAPLVYPLSVLTVCNQFGPTI